MGQSIKPKHLEEISDEEILHPRVRTFTRWIWDDTEGKEVKKTYRIRPLPDKVFGTILGEFNRIISVLSAVADLNDTDSLSISSLAPALSGVVSILLPNATVIISTCFGIAEEVVADDWFLDEKIDALTSILQANRADLLLKKLSTVTAPYLQRTQQPTTPTTSLPESYSLPALNPGVSIPTDPQLDLREQDTIKLGEEDGSTPSSVRSTED